ncbi:MAG: hypothetical protein RL136_1368 [Planctomycetota bacterium]|jgi:hypothetical protein
MKHSDPGSRSNAGARGGFVVFVVRRPDDLRRIRPQIIERIGDEADEPRRREKSKARPQR